MERLILVRHAESVFNVRGILNADPAVPGGLSDRGRRQAARLGRLLADEPIDLCVTTTFERTRETADVAFAGRRIPRLVAGELDDPPNGVFELGPAEALAEWRHRHGPDEVIPGTGRSERELVLPMLGGASMLLARPESTIVAIAHGWFVGWITRAALGPSETIPAHAEPITIDSATLARVIDQLSDDPYRSEPPAE